MDSTTVSKYTKFRKYLLDFGLIIAIIVFCIGTIFIGVVIGESSARSVAEKEKTQLIESYRETISAKDQVIAALSQSTVKATDAVVAVTTQTNQTIAAAGAAATKSEAAARTAADAARVASAAKAAKVAEDARKLKGLQ